MTDHKPITPEQRRAAAMLGAGQQIKDVSTALGVSTKTVSRWQQRDDFRALARRHREQLVADVPDAEAVLVSALGAVTAGGRPDWNARIAAAKALMSSPVASPEAEAAARTTTIYMPPEGE